jgi:Grap2 and cyclin-D-interacting
MQSSHDVLASLRSLAQQLQHGVSHEVSAPKLSHYRNLPESVVQSYEILSTGARLIHATATKFTLVGKIDAEQTKPLQEQLLQGCELVATGCISICSDGTGCAMPTRRHVRSASRNIVQAVISLVEAVTSSSADDAKGIIDATASKTGVVWEACEYVSNKKLPMGNRNAIRRDLLTYQMECQETLQEFQQMLDEGPSCETIDKVITDAALSRSAELSDEGAMWEAFLSDQNNQYSEIELSVAVPCHALLKCSRGCLNVALQTMEAAGQDPCHFPCIAELIHKVQIVGDGVTELGACLYPPLNYEGIEKEATRQANAIRETLDYVHELSRSSEFASIQLPEETIDLRLKVAEAVERREFELLEAISVVTTIPSNDTIAEHNRDL